MFNIALFGDQQLVPLLGSYLGNTSKSQSAIVYFEFPNPNVEHITNIEIFQEKLRIYTLQPILLQTMLVPKRDLNDVELGMWVFDWNNLDSLEKTFSYYKKIVQARKGFIPIFLIGYRAKEEFSPNPAIRFLNMFRFHRLLEQLIQLPVYYVEITENVNESVFISRLSAIIQSLREKYGEISSFKKFSSIAAEELCKSIESFFPGLSEISPNITELLTEIAINELRIKRPMSRRYLENYFGTLPDVAKQIMNDWESRVFITDFEPEKLAKIEKKASEVSNTCQTVNEAPNFINLISMGFDPIDIKYILQYMYEKKVIPEISMHIESEDYAEFRNIRDVIVLHEGKTLHVKTTSENTDNTQLFSGMIQAIEMIRDEYISKVEGPQRNGTKSVEGLEFGDLNAYIGRGNKGLKLILRLNTRPRKDITFKKRVQGFLNHFESDVPLDKLTEIEDQRKIREMADHFFNQYFNPCPISYDVFKPLSVATNIDLNYKTDIEKKIIEILKESKSLLMEELLEKVTRSFGGIISSSDLIIPIFDLIEDKIIE